jgi:hypothetical protein
MKNESCLLDKMIVLDIILQRPRYPQIKKFFESQNLKLCISVSTFLTTFYLLRKYSKDKFEVINLLNQFELIEILPSDCLLGASISKNDDNVEDCTELAIVKRLGLKFLLTADKSLKKDYQDFTRVELV